MLMILIMCYGVIACGVVGSEEGVSWGSMMVVVTVISGTCNPVAWKLAKSSGVPLKISRST